MVSKDMQDALSRLLARWKPSYEKERCHLRGNGAVSNVRAGGCSAAPACARGPGGVASDSGPLTAVVNQHTKTDFGALVQGRAPIFLRAHLTRATQNTAVEHEYALF